MRTLICILLGHVWRDWELVHFLHFRRIGKVTGLYFRNCQRCHTSDWKVATALKT